jgi:aminopeptidase N
LSPSAQPERISIDYTFSAHDTFDGLLPGGMTFTWPYFCENLFPCNPDPSDGLRFTLTLADTPAGSSTVFGASTQLDAPSYMIGWASANYTKLDLGRTRAGTELSVWHTRDNDMEVITGVQALPAVFEFYETLLGPYPYGSSAGSVEVDWGPTGLGGMEHHPYWHVHTSSMSDPVVHAHEAAHGWFGNGVRIACWEDLVLSEGLASYLAARALGTVLGDGGAEVWASYRSSLERAVTARGAPTLVWPESCGAIDVLADGFVGQVLYMKGAFLMRALELRIGAAALDSALGRFVSERMGGAARFQDLLDTIEDVAGYDPNACAQGWLRRGPLPPQATCL